MKAYLCQTDAGPQYIHLQADAKKLDPSFVTEDIDLTKEPLLARINDLMRRAHANEVAPAVSLEEEQDINPPALASPPAPKVSSMPPHAVRNEIQIDWEEFIFTIPDKEAYRLDALQKVIDAQREIIAKRKAAAA